MVGYEWVFDGVVGLPGSWTKNVPCPAGKTPVSAGHRIFNADPDVFVYRSSPDLIGQQVGWDFDFLNNSGGAMSVDVAVLCVTTPPA